MEPPLAPDSEEERIATARELLWLAEQYLERGDSSRAATTVSIAEDIIAALEPGHFNERPSVPRHS